MIESEILEIKLNGEDCKLEIKKDLTWGEVKIILSKSQTKDGFNFGNFLDLISTSAIVKGLPFTNSMVEFSKLPMAEFSLLMGRILKIIPLETWGENFGAEGLLGLIPQSQTI